ncbi:MAG: YfhO family protein [Clostridia bacterium]|nr:YfhO family protein [Clostridia bacterium]
MSASNALRNKFKFDRESPWYFYRKVIWWSFIVSVCITVPFVIVEWIKTGSPVFLYYGDYNAQQICFYENCVRMVQDGSFGWDWVTDMGSNFIGSYSYYMLGSPFFWLMCIFPSTWAPYLMAPIYIIKYIVAAVIAYAYLQRFVKNKNYAVIGALLYSFSGFQIYNTFFNQFHEVVAFFPLLLIGMEELVQNDRKGVFAVAVAINAVVNYFMFAGQVVFCVIYFLFRMPSRSFKITLGKLGGLVIEAVIGFALSMFMFLPAAAALMGNSRITSSYLDTLSNMFEQLSDGDFDKAKDSVKRLLYWRKDGEFYWQRYGQILESYFFPPDIPSRVNFFSGHETRWASISMYLPMFSLSGVFALFTVRRRWWLKGIIITLIAFSFVPILNSSFFLFNSSYYARWLYMMIMMLTLATVISLEDARTNWRIPTAIMAAACTLIALPLGLIWHENSNDKMLLGYPPYRFRFWLYVGIAFLGIILTAFFIRRFRGRKVFDRALLFGVCGMTVLYGCVHITNGKQYSHKSDFMVDQCIEGEVNLPDPHEEFYRIDFYRDSNTSTIDNLGIYWNYPTIECFHTVVPPSIMEFYPIIGVTRSVGSRAESTLHGLRAFTSTKYSFIESSKQLSNKTNANGEKIGIFKEEHEAFGFEYLESQNGYDIYINNNYIPMGFAYTEFMTQSDFEKKYGKSSRDKMLCQYLVVPDDMVAYYSQFMDRVTPTDAIKATDANFEASVKDRREMCCDSFEYDSYGFNASITLDEPRIVYFSVPYEENGWHAKVNGKEKDVLRVTYGFVGVECEAGENEIVFDYTTPGLIVSTEVSFSEIELTLPGGVWISLGALVVYVLYMLYFKVLKKQKATNKFFSFDYYDDLGAYIEKGAKEETVVKAIPITVNVEEEIAKEPSDESEEDTDDTFEEANEASEAEDITENDISE